MTTQISTKPVPVGRRASQPRRLQRHHDADLAGTDLGQQLLEAFAVCGTRARSPLVLVDDLD